MKDSEWKLDLTKKQAERYLREFKNLDEAVRKSLIVSSESMNRRMTI